jgi:uncharacterized membrane protein YkvA (DUF1232 family)
MTQNSSTGRGWRPADLLNDATKAMQLFFHPNVPLSLKLLLPVAALAYWIFPFDLLPGLPFDDIAVLLIALRLFVHFAEPAVQRGRSSDASSQPSQGDDAVDTTWRVIE